MSPGKRKAPEGTGADAITRHHRPESYTDRHTIAMFGMAWRIRWLGSHRHWWLRTEDGRDQREFLDRRDAA